MAPADQMQAFLPACVEGGSFDPQNTADAVFADWLGDCGDVREMILRRDLEFRQQGGNQGGQGGSRGDWHAAANDRLRRLVGTRRQEQYIGRFTLPDVTRLEVTQYESEQGRAYWITWTAAPHTEDFGVDYGGVFTPEETQRIMSGLGLRSDG